MAVAMAPSAEIPPRGEPRPLPLPDGEMSEILRFDGEEQPRWIRAGIAE